MSDAVTPQGDRMDSEIAARPVLSFGAALLATMGAVLLLMWLLWNAFTGRDAAGDQAPPALPEARAPRTAPGPNLQPDPRQDMVRMRAEESEALGSYGWVDKSAGIGRIPIDEAMKIVVERAPREVAP